MRRLLPPLAAGALLLLIPATAEACAGCSNPNLPVGRIGAGQLRAGQLALSLPTSATAVRVVHAEHCPDIGPVCQQREEPPQLHDQVFHIAELRPTLEVGLSDTWGVEVQLPLRYTRTRVTFRRLDGSAFTPDYESIHHRNETLWGPGDPWVSARAGWQVGEVALTARAGASLPLGRTEPNPFLLGREGRPHQHLQFGAGTPGTVLSLDGSGVLGRVRVQGYGQAQLFPFENRHGFQAGHRFALGTSAGVDALGRLHLALGADVLSEQPERWDGRVEQDGNVGRTDVLVGGSLAYPFGPLAASLAVKVPVYQHFIEAPSADPAQEAEGPGQLRYPAIVTLTLTAVLPGAAGR